MSESTPLLSAAKREEPGFLKVFDYVLILPALLLNMFLAAFETTVAASTQSAVGATFRASDDIAWVATSYLIVSTAVQPLYGRASDLFGRTPVYLFSLAVFGIGSLCCGLSRNLGEMIAARAFCGIGGGGLITVSQVCAWDLLPVRHRPLYQALNNVTYGVGAAMGASLGGLLSDSIGWRWGYLIPAPVSVFSIAVFLTRARPKFAEIHRPVKGSRGKLDMHDVDLAGSGLLMTMITLLMLVVNLGGEEIPWRSPIIPAILAALVVITALFLRQEKRIALPVLPIGLIRSRHMISQTGLNIFGAMTVFATLFSIPLYFQTSLLTSASIASRRLLYPTLTAPVGSIITGLCLHRWPGRARHGQRLGSLVLLFGTSIMLAMSFDRKDDRPEWWYIAHLVWVHLGMGILFISSLLDILSGTGNDHAAATSLIFLLRSIGTVLGISGSQAVLQNVVWYKLNERIDDPEVIRNIRQSVEYLASLPPDLRETAMGCYRRAFQATFASLVGAATLAVVSAGVGLGARGGGAQGGDGSADGYVENSLNEGVPVLD